MTTPKIHSPNPRLAFTLVELMVAITVIGLLAGILLVAVAPAFKRANEATIQFEMKQIEVGIEKFKTKYGFYPPSFVRIANPGDMDGNGNANEPADSMAALLPYLNRIAPNHQELSFIGGPTLPRRTRLEVWWEQVGQHIGHDDGDDLVFWLSAVCKNKQFPLTDGADGSSVPNFINTCPSAYENEGGPERENFFDFNTSQLEIENAGTVTQVAHYLSPKGKRVPGLLGSGSYLYIDANSYGWDAVYDGYHVLDVTNSSNPVRYYENPRTFQLITFGMDGRPGASTSMNSLAIATTWAERNSSGGTPSLSSPVNGEAEDNLVNFLDGGRMERLILGTFPSTANAYQP